MIEKLNYESSNHKVERLTLLFTVEVGRMSVPTLCLDPYFTRHLRFPFPVTTVSNSQRKART